jgi:hypothetical protein
MYQESRKRKITSPSQSSGGSGSDFENDPEIEIGPASGRRVFATPERIVGARRDLLIGLLQNMTSPPHSPIEPSIDELFGKETSEKIAQQTTRSSDSLKSTGPPLRESLPIPNDRPIPPNPFPSYSRTTNVFDRNLPLKYVRTVVEEKSGGWKKTTTEIWDYAYMNPLPMEAMPDGGVV